MAWNSSDTDTIAAYLGYPINAANLAAIQAAMDLLTDISATDAIARIQGYMATIATLETEIADARGTVGGAMNQLKTEARRFAGLIGSSLDLKVYRDSWSA